MSRALRLLPCIFALAAAASACDDDAASPPRVEIYLNGALAPASPAVDFPDTPAGSDGVATQVELKNVGPGPLELTGNPPLRIERDDRLAFRVAQPNRTRFVAGESLTFSVVFAPHSPGISVARLAIPVAHSAEPLVIALSGQGINDDAPRLSATLDGVPLGPSFDFGSIAALSTAEANLRLTNVGSGVLDLGATPATLRGADARVFSLEAPSTTSLAEGEHVDLTLSFTPDGCGGFGAFLDVEIPADPVPITVALEGRGGENPQGHAGVTDTSNLDAPDLDLALSGPGAGTKRRFAVGNLTIGSFAGQVGTYGWDGCTLSEPRSLSAAGSGLSAQLFGNQVALTDDGTTLLVSGRDQRKDAWVYTIGADGLPRFAGTLATFDEAPGHGRGAAIAGDGSAAFVGQTGADSGFNAHGAVYVYERGAGGWGGQPEAAFRLQPSNPTSVELIGAWVEASRSGDVVVSGALATPSGAATPGPAVVYVWDTENTDGGRAWGRPIPNGEPNQRYESLRLLTNEVPSDRSVRVGISADGLTIAVGVVKESALGIRLFVRQGEELWGRPTAVPSERVATATLTFPGTQNTRWVLAPDGAFVIVGDLAGARELTRPSGGWTDDAEAAVGARTWNVPIFGALATTPDGLAFAGVARDGTAWFVFR